MSSDKPSLVGLVVLLISIVNSDRVITTGNKTENVWRTAGKLTGLFLQKCMQLGSDGPQEQFLLILQRCVKRRSLVALDRSLRADVIKLASGIELVRYKKENETEVARQLAIFQTASKSDEKETDWKNQILQKIAHVLNTHALKIRLNSYEELRSFISEARGRKKQNMFMSLLMFGIAAVGLIMVPMGFQFLAVLGGKALLLAKMALILTAIQGLKKIATSNLNYGLYAAPPEHHHGPCKDELCNREFNSLEADDSDVFVAVDVDHPAEFDDINFWHYDRQWPYEAESHDMPASHSNYYHAPEQPADLFHPLHPRVDTFRDMM